MGVAEARKDATPAEVDALGPCERRLMRSDSARDAIAGDREGRCPRERWVERAYDAVLEDHATSCPQR